MWQRGNSFRARGSLVWNQALPCTSCETQASPLTSWNLSFPICQRNDDPSSLARTLWWPGCKCEAASMWRTSERWLLLSWEAGPSLFLPYSPQGHGLPRSCPPEDTTLQNHSFLFISSVSLTENYEEVILVESFTPSYKWLMGLDLQEENSKISFSS